MSNDNLTGQMLGQYELRELLGVGGMGAVYRGFQTTLKREVAVKVLPAMLAQQQGYMERFTREAETSAALEHPHIVPIVDYGTQRGVSYVVMRLLTGGTLAERINHVQLENRGLPSLGETAKLLRELASALDYAHNRGVIHRDIKTSNVMFDNQGNSYLVDFGIAKLMHATNKLTGTGMAVGTPTYMAPEQWAGEEVFPATDQYSLGVLAYIAVTGREPFEAATPFQLLNKHLHEMPTPMTVLRSDLPPAIDLVIARALAKDPKARFPTCTAFAQAFESAVEGNKGGETNFFVFKVPPKPKVAYSPPSPVSTPPYTPTPTPAPKRNNGLIIGMGIIILLLIGVVAVLLLNSNLADENFSISSESTNTTVPPIIILASDEPIITPSDNPTQTALAILMTQTEMAIQSISTQILITSTDVPILITNTLLPSYTPQIERMTNTPLPTYTSVPPTNTAVRITNTPLPTYTSVPPTITAVRITNTPLPTYTPVVSAPQVQINGFGTWVREYPSEDSTLLGSIINETADILGISSDGAWVQIAYRDGLGWIQMGNQNQAVTILGDLNRLSVITVSIPTQTPFTATLMVNQLGAYIRALPDVSSRRLGTIIGDEITVIGISEDREWYAVDYEGVTAWIAKDINNSLSINDRRLTIITIIQPTLTIDGLGVWVRVLPQSDARRLGSFINVTVDVVGISDDGGWYAVMYEGEIGWIGKSDSAVLNGDENQLTVITP